VLLWGLDYHLPDEIADFVLSNPAGEVVSFWCCLAAAVDQRQDHKAVEGNTLHITVGLPVSLSAC
jgi:hypothetical protein